MSLVFVHDIQVIEVIRRPYIEVALCHEFTSETYVSPSCLEFISVPCLKLLSGPAAMARNPWESDQGIGRLSFLPALNPGPPPAGPPLDLDDPDMFLWHFRNYARTNVDAELLMDRETLWLNPMLSLQTSPPWMTLRPDPQLRIWKEILQDELGCDFRSLETFVTLVRKGPRGYCEACRVLAHLLKDKDLDPSKPKPEASKWLKRACDEAIDAIDDPSAWEHGPQGHPTPYKGQGAWAEKGAPPEWSGKGASSSSAAPTTSSSTAWGTYVPGKGSKGPSGSSSSSGPSKGKGYWQGLR